MVQALQDDLNTPKALSELFKLARQANRQSGAAAREAADAVRAGGWLLGLLGQDPGQWFSQGAVGNLTAPVVEALLAERATYRLAGDFRAADRIRKTLAEGGVLIEDGPDGTRWRRER